MLATSCAAAVLCGTLALAPDGDAVARAAARVDDAVARTNEGPEAITELAAALEHMRALGPAVAANDGASTALVRGELTLARALLGTGDEAGARATIDDVIRSAAGAPVPYAEFGPAFVKVYEERAAALAGTSGTIEVRCASPCDVVINERKAEPRSDGLPLGEYRVWVSGTDAGSDAALRKTVVLDEDGEVETIMFGDPVPAAAGPVDPPPRRRATARDKPARMLPRWVEIVGMGLGAAAIAAGAVLLVLDGQCTTEECPDIYATQEGGIALLASGGTLLLTGTVLLGVDEARVRRSRRAARTVSLGLRWRF